MDAIAESWMLRNTSTTLPSLLFFKDQQVLSLGPESFGLHPCISIAAATSNCGMVANATLEPAYPADLICKHILLSSPWRALIGPST